MVVWRVTELIIREKALLCDHTGLFIRYKLHRSGERNHWPWLGYAWYYVTHTYKDSKHWPTEMLSIARHLKNLRSFCTHDRPHTKWNIHTAETYHLHGRNVYDIHESMRGYPSFLVFQNRKVSPYVQCQVTNKYHSFVNWTYGRRRAKASSSSTHSQHEKRAFLQHSYVLLLIAYCHQQTRLNQQNYSAWRTPYTNLKCKIKTPTNFGKCLNCTTGILGLFKRFQTLASTDWLTETVNMNRKMERMPKQAQCIPNVRHNISVKFTLIISSHQYLGHASGFS